MTVQEKVIKYLKEQKKEYGTPSIFADYCDIAIQALEELEQYRALGTVEEIEKKIQTELPYMSLAQARFKSELDEYRNIGTVEELKEAMEKQVAKKPLADSYGEIGMGFLVPICPNCRKPVEEGEHHCKCGQALKWGEEDD